MREFSLIFIFCSSKLLHRQQFLPLEQQEHMVTIPIFVELTQDTIVGQTFCFHRFLEPNFVLLAYLDVSQTSTDEATLTFSLGDATLNQWKIKVMAESMDLNL